MAERITIDVWSDIVCPWCYIGKRRLEMALDDFAAGHGTGTDRDGEATGGPSVEVVYHSFELMPETPKDVEGSAAEHLAAAKGIPEARAAAMQDEVAKVAESVGLTYDFERLRPANTVKAHQVLHLARDRGRQPEMKERLLRAHFTEGRHVGRDDELADLAADVGLDRDEVVRALAQETYLAAVDADKRQARELGIGGVPFYVVDRRYAVSGAQPPEVFTRALERVHADREAGTAA